MRNRFFLIITIMFIICSGIVSSEINGESISCTSSETMNNCNYSNDDNYSTYSTCSGGFGCSGVIYINYSTGKVPYYYNFSYYSNGLSVGGSNIPSISCWNYLTEDWEEIWKNETETNKTVKINESCLKLNPTRMKITFSNTLEGDRFFREGYLMDINNNTLKYGKAILNITFSENTNITINSEENTFFFEKNKSIQINRTLLEDGLIITEFGNNQIYSFENEKMGRDFYMNLTVIDTNLVQKIKTIESAMGIKDALITVYKQTGGTYEIIDSVYTDGNGIGTIEIEDGITYKITAEKEGYENETEIRYIPNGNTETILINMNKIQATTGRTTFITNCKNKIATPTMCYFKVKTYEEKNNITIIINLNGTITSKTCLNEDNCLSNNYNISNISYPINASLYLNEILVNPIIKITYTELGAKSIQINFPVQTIKSNSNYLVLFYFMTLLVGLAIAVSIETKIKGWGLLVFIVWLGIIAVSGFWEYWLVILPLVIIQIAKFYYEWLK